MHKTLILILTFLLNWTFLFADNDQSITQVKGIVTSSSDNETMEDVLVTNENTLKYTITDENGSFVINATKGQFLVFTKLGIKSKRVEVTAEKINVILDEQNVSLGEVTVVAKQINDIDIRNLTGDIVTIDAKNLENRPETDITRLLQGQVPGLVVTVDGELGTKSKVRIRGEHSFIVDGAANEPLYVLDGIVINSDAFLALNVNDIDQIKVLKDAAATALYGIKAANGVIELTTKRGYEGAAYVSVNANYGITFRGPRGVEMMDSAEKLELERRLQNFATPGYAFSEDYYRKHFANDPNLEQMIATGAVKLDSLRNINTDWFKKLIKTNVTQNYSVGIRGGNKKSSYYYSASYNKRGGRFEGNQINNFTGTANLDYVISPKFSVRVGITGGYSKTETPNDRSEWILYSPENPTTLVYTLNPYEQMTDPVTGESPTLYSYPDMKYSDFINQYTKESTNKSAKFLVDLKWNISKDLYIQGVMGGDLLFAENKELTPATAYIENKSFNSPEEKGKLIQDKGSSFNFTSNYRLYYSKSLGDHDISATVNTDYLRSSKDDIGLTGYGIPMKVNTVSGINQGLTGSRKVSVHGSTLEKAEFGFGGSAGYSYQNTYDAYASYKRDGSSLMPSDKRWNDAWSAGIGWSPSSYAFLKDSKILTHLKLKASYGYTAGLAGVAANMTTPTFSYITGSTKNVYANDRIFRLEQLPNVDLKPQKVKSLNFALETGFFNRLDLRASLYRSRTEDALLTVSIPSSNGFSTLTRNVGILENRGYEINVSGHIVRGEHFSWNAAAHISWNRNKVIDLYDGTRMLKSDGVAPYMEEGKPLGVLFGFEALGINPLDGLPYFLNAAGEEFSVEYARSLKTEDYISLGYETAPYTGGFNQQLSYRNIELVVNFYYQFGGIAKYSSEYARNIDDVNFNAIKGQVDEMWFKKGDENKRYPIGNQPASLSTLTAAASTKTIYKTDYLRLQHVRLTYVLPSQLIQKISRNYMKYLSVNMQGENLFSMNKEKDKGSLASVMQPVLSIGLSAQF